ncbi:hypothetical protein G6F54_014156 [Rhizopus delemar]|nr:hypothetical protein G6F54_014156 [Rhizopus delemar]
MACPLSATMLRRRSATGHACPHLAPQEEEMGLSPETTGEQHVTDGAATCRQARCPAGHFALKLKIGEPLSTVDEQYVPAYVGVPTRGAHVIVYSCPQLVRPGR